MLIAAVMRTHEQTKCCSEAKKCRQLCKHRVTSCVHPLVAAHTHRNDEWSPALACLNRKLDGRAILLVTRSACRCTPVLVN